MRSIISKSVSSAALAFVVGYCGGDAHAQQGVLRWTFTGESTGDQLGLDVTYMGDIDGDGLPEIIVTDADDLVPSLGYPGYIEVYGGGGGNLIYRLNGEHILDLFGSSTDTPGDVDGDGTDDIAVGAPYFHLTPQATVGKLYLYSGATGALIWSVLGEASGDFFGSFVAAVGDIDGDGIGDIATGAHKHDSAGRDAGRVYIFSGGDGVLIRTADGHASNEHFGASVAGLGDLDMDGVGDYVVGATENSQGGHFGGAAYVYSGVDGALLHTFIGQGFPGLNGGEFGAEAHSIGDVTADGVPDFVIAAEEFDVTMTVSDDTGRVYLYSGADFSLLAIINGPLYGGQFGNGVGGGGDVDGDGISDFVVGADQTGQFGANTGTVYVHSGATFQPIFTVAGTAPGQHMGSSVACDRDIDGDGLADVLIGAFGDSTSGSYLAGRVYVYHAPGHGGPGLAGACAAGNTTSSAGQLVDLLTLNASTGGPQRRVDVAGGTNVHFALRQPATNPYPAQHAVWLWLGVPAATDATALPFNIGTMCFVPCEMNPAAPVFDLTNTFGTTACPPYVVATPTPWSWTTASPPFPIAVTLQGIVERAPGQITLTNAVILDIQ